MDADTILEIQEQIDKIKAQVEADRKREILKLREGGMTYEAIGKKFGISKQAVHQIIKAMENDTED